MRQIVLDRYKFTFSSQYHKVYPLLCTVAVSICWVLAVSEKSSAQVNPSQLEALDYQLGLAEPLPVAKLPVPGSQTLHPPRVTTGVAVAPIANPALKVVEPKPVNDLQQMESAFIEQQVTGKAPAAARSSIAPRVAAGSGLNLGLQGQMNGSEPPSNSAPPPPLANLPVTQEFTAPAAPTFNQLLSSQIAPLPPLPNLPATPEFTAPGVAPTFNQQLNPQTTPSVLSTTPTPSAAVPVNPSTTTQQRRQLPSSSLREPSLQFQGVYITQGGDTSARARVTGIYPLSPQALIGATLDLTSQGTNLDDSRNEGLNINELYLATSLAGVPNLRFVIGQIDLTSYFDRNSFAKDGASQFFNPVFQTNPALAATGISSRTGLLADWSVTDNIEAKAAVFSSADKIGDFSLDGFAGEIGVRYGNAIIRGTYASDRDAGVGDSFLESYSLARGNNQFGPDKNDREEAYGVNAEVFIPNLKLGLFGRYGRYENRTLGEGANTYVLGASFLDLFTPDDRLGIAYGRALSNDRLRRENRPDVLEMFYDFKFIDNLRIGFSVQARDDFSETVFGVRVKSEFDVTPRGRITQ
ncbi:carbohydrate porin [Nostoc sp. UHCC 0251]|uniref:carbohydrate porin n=1 Tax=Nostoc sp. UHCC 0251 TaxID=3110240 RepID=UPI002B210603|nr:carbohydrate porin [Nostoc sp. UHCC 0251]MEA5625740.1 carbohydrate porin [Nostoc sp. UHCC 0251]